MIRLIEAALGVANRHGIAAGWRAFWCGFWWGRKTRIRHRERMAEIRDVNEYHRAAFQINSGEIHRGKLPDGRDES